MTSEAALKYDRGIVARRLEYALLEVEEARKHATKLPLELDARLAALEVALGLLVALVDSWSVDLPERLVLTLEAAARLERDALNGRN